MGSNFLYPPAKRPLPDPNPFQRNGSSQRLKSSKPPTLSVPPGHVAFRLLCNASRIGGVIGRSGAVIKTLQQSTDAKIRIEDAPPESPDRVILVVAAAALSSKILFRSHRDVRSGDDEVVEVSKAQEALLKVFDRILEVVAEMEGIEFFDRAVSCRLVADKAQAGSVIGKGGMVVEKIRKDTGCIIRVLNDDLPACTSDSDEVIEIEGDVPSVKKALVAVSRRLQDCSPADRTKMMGSKPHEVVQHEALIAMPREASTAVPRETLTAVPHKTFTDWHVDHLPLRSSALSTLSSSSNNYATDRHIDHLQLRSSALSTISSSSNNYADYATDRHVDHLQLRSSALSTLSSSSNNYATGVHSLSAEANRISSLEPKVTQQDVTFRILCSNDRIGGIIGKGGGIVRALQSETGATISIGPSVAECEDRLINITASENPESRYSPAQKAAVLVFSRSIETGIEKGFDSKGTSVTVRLVVPSNQVGCLLGKGGVIVSEMRKATGANIRIIGSDQVPKCASDNDQVVQISGAFSSVQDALYNATGRLRDNLFVSTQDSGGTRSLSSIQVDTSSFGRPRDVVPLGGPVVAASHSLNRHSFVQGIDHLSLSRNFDRSSSPSHSLRDVVPLGGSVVAASHSMNIHSFAQGIEHLPLSRNLDQSSSPSHSFRDVVPLGGSVVAASHGLNRHSFAQGIDHLPLSRNLDRSSSPGLWTPPTVASINSRDINDVSWGLSSRKGGLELVSGSKSAIVTNTTVEIVVPDDTIDSVYGENGSNLARLRQISGAKVVIHEPRPGTSDRIIVISGSPDETQAAQSLLQAFILSGSS